MLTRPYNGYTDYSVNTCEQCGMYTNNLVFCDDLCWRMHQQFDMRQFRTNDMPEGFSGKAWDWYMTDEERETAAIYTGTLIH